MRLRNVAGEGIRRILTPMGLQIRRISGEANWANGRVGEGKRLYVGCGEHELPGFLGCDVRPLPNVEVVCKAWHVSRHCAGLAEIYTRHMLEHLTLAEVETTLEDWHKSLAVGGRLHIVVPNLDHHIQQWLRAEWTEETFANKKSDARWGMAGFYGWQRECDPKKIDYNSSYWDVHKSGYNERVLRFLLTRAGYAEVEISVEDQVHLVGKCVKS